MIRGHPWVSWTCHSTASERQERYSAYVLWEIQREISVVVSYDRRASLIVVHQVKTHGKRHCEENVYHVNTIEHIKITQALTLRPCASLTEEYRAANGSTEG